MLLSANLADGTTVEPFEGAAYIACDKSQLESVDVTLDDTNILHLRMVEGFEGQKFFARKRNHLIESIGTQYLFIGWDGGPVYLISDDGRVSGRRHYSEVSSLYQKPEFFEGEISLA